MMPALMDSIKPWQTTFVLLLRMVFQLMPFAYNKV